MPSPTLPQQLKRARKMPDSELYRALNTLSPASEPHIAAKTDLERRKAWRQFWSKDIVSWIVLVLSVVAIFTGIKK